MSTPMPPLIYGTAWKQERTTPMVMQAVRAGFRGIDTACQPRHYREELVGEALSQLAEEGFERDSLYIQTKFTPKDGQDLDSIPYDPDAPLQAQVESSFLTSLGNLRTDYLDAYILHTPLFPHKRLMEVWRVMEHFYLEGKIKRLGISNCYEISQLRRLYEDAQIKPTIVQNRFYKESGFDSEIRTWCDYHHVTYQSFWSLTANSHILETKILFLIARKYGVEPAQIFFRFLSHIGITPLTGTTSLSHVKADLEIFSFELSFDEIDTIQEMLLA